MFRALAANERLRAVAACAAIVYIALFWRLGTPTFWDPDEAHYAETTKEMLESGDWLTPTYNQRPFFDKPIVFHWFQGAAAQIVGLGEAAARLPGSLAGVLLVAVTFWVGQHIASRRVGALAALLLAVNPGLFGLARYAILDAPFTLCLFGGVACLARAAMGRGNPAPLTPRPSVTRARTERWLEPVGYLGIAAAVCIKGPVAMALCGVSLLMASIASAEVRRRLFGLHWVIGLMAIVALSSPWFVVMWLRHGDAFVEGYVLNENLRLFSAPLYANQPGWSFYLQILVVGFLPWTGLVVGRGVDQLRAAQRRQPSCTDRFDVMLWSWAAGVVVFFSASHFKLDHYVFPAAPALCLLAARAWHDAREHPREWPASHIGVVMLGPVLMVAGAVVAFLATTRLALPPLFLTIPAGIMAFGALTVWQDRRPSAAPSFALTALALLYVGVIVFVLPALEQGKVIPDLARWVQAHAGPADRIGTFRLSRWNPAFRFYVSRPVTMFDSDDDAGRFFAAPTPAYCVMTEELFALLTQAGAPIEAVYKRSGVWVTSGKLLWRARGQPTVFVVVRRTQTAQTIY